MKNSHLCWRSEVGAIQTHASELDRVAKPYCHALCPGLELLTNPFKTVIIMPEGTGSQVGPHHVVFPVRRRQHDSRRPCALEHNPLEGGQPWRIKMLDDLDDSRRLKPGQPF